MSDAIDRARRYVRPVIYLAILTALLIPYFTTTAEAEHKPANKVAASGSSLEVMGDSGDKIPLMTERLKTSRTTDLLIGVTAECSIITELLTIGTDDEAAEGELKISVEIDGDAVPVAENDADEGRVVFCNQENRRSTVFSDQESTIDTYLRTRTANGFNWLALNLSADVHEIVVYGHFLEASTEDADAQAVVGNRTIVIEPVKAANDEHVNELGDRG